MKTPARNGLFQYRRLLSSYPRRQSLLSTQGVNDLGELTVPEMTDAHVKQALMRAGRQKSCWRTAVNLVKRSLQAMPAWQTLTSLSARPASPRYPLSDANAKRTAAAGG
jgi:hypothetical protein